MKDLTKATGVTKATVQHYIKEGLVPKPIKTSRNMGYYDESHVKAIHMVRELQSKRFLPLSVIRQVMKGGRGGLSLDEIRTLAQIDGKLFRSIEGDSKPEAIAIEDLSARAGVSLKNIRIMEQQGLIRHVKEGKNKLLREDDIRIVECFGRLQELGLNSNLGVDASILKIHYDLLKILVEEEAKIVFSRVTGKVPVQKLPALVEGSTAVVNTIMNLLHKKIIVETASRYSLEFRKKGSGAEQGNDVS